MDADEKKQAEIQKPLHILHTEEADKFIFFDKLSGEELQLLRQKINDITQFTQTDIWKRLTGVSKFLPNYMSAKIAESVMGPLITANMSYYMPIKDAVSIMKHLSIPYLATAAEYMTPENARQLINEIPIDILKKVTTELVQKKKYLVAAGFVDVSEISRLIELSKVITKEEDLIRISSYVENKAYIAKIVERFSDDRLQKIISTAYQFNLQDEVLTVFTHQSAKEVQRILRIISLFPIHLKTQILNDFEHRITPKDEH